jgi:protein disulfide-isomerase
MKSLSSAVLLLATGVLWLSPVIAAETTHVNWTTDYAAALEQAKAQNKHVFLFFTGSDWCSWCKKLRAEVLTKPEFAAYASANLILVELDFPQRKKLPASLVAQNEKLMEQYKIEGFPTAIVLDSAGQKVGEIGYQPGGPGPFIAALQKM